MQHALYVEMHMDSVSYSSVCVCSFLSQVKLKAVPEAHTNQSPKNSFKNVIECKFLAGVYNSPLNKMYDITDPEDAVTGTTNF